MGREQRQRSGKGREKEGEGPRGDKRELRGRAGILALLEGEFTRGIGREGWELGITGMRIWEGERDGWSGNFEGKQALLEWEFGRETDIGGVGISEGKRDQWSVNFERNRHCWNGNFGENRHWWNGNLGGERKLLEWEFVGGKGIGGERILGKTGISEVGICGGNRHCWNGNL